MKERNHLSIPDLYLTLRPEDKLALICFYEEVDKGSRPIIKTRRGDTIATILSYAGLILVVQNADEYGRVREFTRRGVEFYRYMMTRIDVHTLSAMVADANAVKKIAKG